MCLSRNSKAKKQLKSDIETWPFGWILQKQVFMERWAENMNQSLISDFFLNLVNSPKHLMLVLSKIIKKRLSKILKNYNFFSRTHSLFQKTITKNKSSDQYRFRFPSMFENFLFSKIYCQANFDVLAQIGFWVSLKI